MQDRTNNAAGTANTGGDRSGKGLCGSIPASLTSSGRFCVWAYEERDGQRTKIPYNPNTGRRAKTNDSSTFGSYEEAYALYSREPGRYDGLGIGIFDALVGIDIDHCRDGDALSPVAQEIMETCDSYTEVSPSGEGIHILGRAEDLNLDKEKYYTKNPDNGVEIYAAGQTSRYLTLTGNVIYGEEIKDCGTVLPQIMEKYMKRPDHATDSTAKPPSITDGRRLTDEEIITKAHSARNREKFSRLWNGDTGEYDGDDSAADLALCNCLAFWTQKDPEQMDRLFRESGLYRDKWDEQHGVQTYGQMTIHKAIQDCKEVWTPERESKVATGKDVFKEFGFYSLSELTDEDRRPPEFIIDGMIPVGLTFLSGAPKTRKSFLALQMAIAVAKGDPFFGRKTMQCGVAYLDLEGNKSRISARTAGMWDEIPDSLVFVNKMPLKLADDLVDMIRKLHQQRPSIRFIIIDTYSHARGMVKSTGQNAYDADVALLEPLQRMAMEEKVAVMCVHHNKKGASLMADTFEMLSGTMGISGSADCVCTLITEGKRLNGKATLECTPRDARSFEQRIRFDDVLLEWLPEEKQDPESDPLCAWVLANVPKKGLIGDFISYDDCYRAVYNRCSEDCGTKIREALGQHRIELFTEYSIGIQLGVKTNGQRGLRIVNMG